MESTWIRRSADDPSLSKRLIWIAGNNTAVEDIARDLHRSQAIINRYQPRRESLPIARQRLLLDEGTLFFQGRSFSPTEIGSSFSASLLAAGNQVRPNLYPHFNPIQIQPTELAQLLRDDLNGVSTKFLPEDLGILELDNGRYVPGCSGAIPRRVLSAIEDDEGLDGADLLKKLGTSPYGYAPGVAKACVAGLLRASKIGIQPETGAEITARRDPGVQDLFNSDRSFKRARFSKAGDDGTSPTNRARICNMFRELLSKELDREEDPIADAVSELFPEVATRLREVQTRLSRIPWDYQEPVSLARLQSAVELCLGNQRQTRPTVLAVLRQLDALREGITTLRAIDAEVKDDTISALVEAHSVVSRMAVQITALGIQATNVDAAATRIRTHLESPQPWRGLAALEPDLEEIRSAYRSERSRLIQEQEQRLEVSRERVRGCQGFSTLTADQNHEVLRPFAACAATTDEFAIAPSLVDLKDNFPARLQLAESEARAVLDRILLDTGKVTQVTQQVDLDLHNRELNCEEDVKTLVKEIEDRLLPLVEGEGRVRIL